MVDQPFSPLPKRPRISGKLTLPPVDIGMNKIKENNRAIEGKGPTVGPKIPNTESGDDKTEKKNRKKADHAEILERIRKRMERCIAAEADNRKAAVDDRKFKAGNQWPADVAQQRNTDKRPMITNNRMKTFVHQVTNPARENRPQINISPVGDKADKEAAKVFEGLIRSIERDSHADIAYDTALDDAVTSGWGYMRLLVDWKSPTSFDQVLVIRRVRNPFTVYLDPDRQEPDGSDARFGFVTEIIPEDQFKEDYPDAQPIPFEMGGQGEKFRSWVMKDGIRVAEYYEITEKHRRLVSLSSGYVGWFDDLDDIAKAKVKNGTFDILDERQSPEPLVMYYKVTALEVLEEKEWVGRWVPIIQVIGDEIDIEGKVILSGIIRDAKDSQRMANYWDCVDINTPIPTPSGWTTMREIGPGDQVYNERGEAVAVLGCGPIHINRKCYRVTFDDGSSIVTDDQHPWIVEERGKRTSVAWQWSEKMVRTGALIPGRHVIRKAVPLQSADADLPIDPYVLGLWLGDGSASSGQICKRPSELEEFREIIAKDGYRLGPISKDTRGDAGAATIYGILPKLRAAGLIGNKHIPDAYLRASERQRWALLQGLMDTDGSCAAANRQCSFSTITPAISAGVSELLWSLGVRFAKIARVGRIEHQINGRGVNSSPSDQFSFTAPAEAPVFRMERKLAMQFASRKRLPRPGVTQRFVIRSVEPVASVPVKCIAVDTPSHLFLVGECMVPTHNTSMAENVALAPKSHYIMTEGQIEGHEQEWKSANTRPRPALTYKAEDVNGHPSPPPIRIAPPEIPAGIVAAKAQAEQSMMATTGIRFDATQQEKMSDESGRAIRELSRKSDIGAFHFYDNFRRSLEFLGRQMVEIIAGGKVYDRRMVLTILRQDDKEENVTLDPMMGQAYKETQGEKGLMRYFNPSFAEWGVTVDVGPSYATKRIEAAESMMEFVKALPNTAQLVMDLIASEMDWPGADKIAARLAKAIPAQFLTADLKDIPPQIQALIQNLETQTKQLQGQLQQAVKALEDKGADREVAMAKISSEYEVKLLNIIAKTEDTGKKLAMEQAKFTAETIIEELRSERTKAHELQLAAVTPAEQPKPDQKTKEPAANV